MSETDRLTTLVDRLLGPKTQPTFSLRNIHQPLEIVRQLIEMESPPSLQIVRDYDPSIPDLTFDHELMVQVFLNIARNAIQSLENTDKPTLTLRTRVEHQLTISSKQHRLVACIEINDNGCGVPDSLAEKFFFPLITGRSEGTGLGLSVAQSIVHLHHGLIEFESKPGDTTFTILIPWEPT